MGQVYYLLDETDREYIRLGKWISTDFGFQFPSKILVGYLIAARDHSLKVTDEQPPISWIRLYHDVEQEVG